MHGESDQVFDESAVDDALREISMPSSDESFSKRLLEPILTGVASTAIFELGRAFYAAAPWRQEGRLLSHDEITELARYVLNVRFSVELSSDAVAESEFWGTQRWAVAFARGDRI